MRVLHIMATGVVSGGAVHMQLLLPELLRLGCECLAAVGTDGDLAQRLAAAGVPTRTIALMASRFDRGAPKRVTALVADTKPDLVHFHGTRAALFGAAARLRPRPPTVYTVHGLSYAKEGGWLRCAPFLAAEAFACRRASHVISVAQGDLEDLRRRRFVATKASCHIPNAVDVGNFTPGEGAEVRARLGIASGEFVAGTVARLVPQKAVGDLVAAAARCKCPVTLLVVGDGPQRLALETQASEHRVRAVFLGERDDVPALLRACDIFALSSRWEGEPLALLEAMATGLPCVATATPGVRQLLSRTPAGTLVPIGDPAALGRALDRWALMPAEERRRFGAGARSLVLERTPANNARQVLDVYERLLG
jgi:glycosyltransferase involved in cell wall biosynthesis